jgi:hypothetical protein
MSSSAGRRRFWWLAAALFGFIGLVNFHFSTSNQIPSDGPLTIGFPMTFLWKVCPMISAGGDACHQEIAAVGLVVDLIVCCAVAIFVAILCAHFVQQDYVKRSRFWVVAGFTFAVIFLITSSVSAWHSVSPGRSIEFGFPLVYLREYAGESWNVLNLAGDAALCFLIAFPVAAAFFRGK